MGAVLTHLQRRATCSVVLMRDLGNPAHRTHQGRNDATFINAVRAGNPGAFRNPIPLSASPSGEQEKPVFSLTQISLSPHL